jgi:hypothetical protein
MVFLDALLYKQKLEKYRKQAKIGEIQGPFTVKYESRP